MSKLHELRALARNLSILYVEDEIELATNVRLYLSKIFKEVRFASNGKEGLELYKEYPSDIVLSDILMPHMNGIEMLKEIKALNPTQHFIISSAYTESQFFVDAIKLGVSSYIIKPIVYEQMIDVLYSTVLLIVESQKALDYHHELEESIVEKSAAYEELEKIRVEDYEKILLALVKMIEQRDSYTAGHSQRVAMYAQMLAEQMGYSQNECNMLYQAGILHDIGKVATPDAILLKPERLNTLEYNLIKEHVNVSVTILKGIPMFEPLIEIIGSHHERYDGEGYPQGLKKEEIPPLARVMIVADAFDAMTTSRIYRHKKSVPEALCELQSLSGQQFDPTVVGFALEAFKDVIIDTETSQLPTSALEEERFAYFYRDNLTEVYNQKYLSSVLLKNSFDGIYGHLFLFSLHNFTAFNHYMGWEAGDTVLRSLASLLSKAYPALPIFRIHANDFIILSPEPLEEASVPKKELLKLLGIHLNYTLRTFKIKEQHIDSMQAFEALIAAHNPKDIL